MHFNRSSKKGLEQISRSCYSKVTLESNNYSIFLGETLGTFVGPGTIGQVVTISSPEPLTGKYVVIQLKEKSQTLNINEVKVTCSAGAGMYESLRDPITHG